MYDTHAARAATLILVVEDDVDHRNIVRDILEEEGYRVMTAIHGRDALARLDDTQFRYPVKLEATTGFGTIRGRLMKFQETMK